MPVLVILIFAMTSRIFAGNYTTPNDSVSTKVDAKRPQISPFNLSKDTNTQQRFRKYDVNFTIKMMNEVLKRRKVLETTFLVPSKQFPLSRNQKRISVEAKRNWKRIRLRKLQKTLSKHISNDLVFGVNATLKDDVSLVRAIDKVSEENRQSKIKFTDLMKAKQLPQPNYVPLGKDSGKNLALSKAERSEMLKVVALGVQSLADQLKSNSRTSRKGKTMDYSRFYNRAGAVFNKEQQALKRDKSIPRVSLIRRSKRKAKSIDQKVKESNAIGAERLKPIEVAKLKELEAGKSLQEREAEILNERDAEKLTETEAEDFKVVENGKFQIINAKNIQVVVSLTPKVPEAPTLSPGDAILKDFEAAELYLVESVTVKTPAIIIQTTEAIKLMASAPGSLTSATTNSTAQTTAAATSGMSTYAIVITVLSVALALILLCVVVYWIASSENKKSEEQPLKNTTIKATRKAPKVETQAKTKKSTGKQTRFMVGRSPTNRQQPTTPTGTTKPPALTPGTPANTTPAAIARTNPPNKP